MESKITVNNRCPNENGLNSPLKTTDNRKKERERESRHTLASTDEKEAIRSDRTVKQIHNRT
jgi:hypothetical protein